MNTYSQVISRCVRWLMGAVLFVCVACSSNEPGESLAPLPEVPETYTFERNGVSTVDYSAQTQQLDMLGELESYIRNTRTLGAAVSAEQLQQMYTNQGNPFSGAFEGSLKEVTYSEAVTFFETWLAETAAASELGGEVVPGDTPGFVSERWPAPATSDSKGYLVNELGIEYEQIIIKGLMGAILYYQAAEQALSKENMPSASDGTAPSEAAIAAMERNFDAAFGYFGVPADFPSNTQGVRFWGNYCNARNNDQLLGYGYPDINKETMDAFLKGRTAISAGLLNERDEALETVAHNWEIVIGATAADYLERSLSANGAPLYQKLHYLSEAIAFTMALNYKFVDGDGRIPRYSDPAKVDAVLQVIGLETNLFEVDDDDINQAISLIKEAFPAGEIR